LEKGLGEIFTTICLFNYGLLSKTGEQVFEVSAKKVQSIMITTSVYLSSDAVISAEKKRVPRRRGDELIERKHNPKGTG
jgi:hypothetical protein